VLNRIGQWYAAVPKTMGIGKSPRERPNVRTLL
jgi:hypothetical protein